MLVCIRTRNKLKKEILDSELSKRSNAKGLGETLLYMQGINCGGIADNRNSGAKEI